jgi:CRP-like cAMP-binding protein
MPSGRSENNSEIYPIDANRLVTALAGRDLDFFNARSTKIHLSLGQVLAEPGDEFEFCYFPVRGVVSMVTLMFSGARAEVGLVGTEGMVGYNALLGDTRAPHQALVQGTGEALRLPVSDLIKLRDQSEAAELLFLRYINSFMIIVSQGAACNALHKAETRMARWILLVQDRLQGDALPITHEFLANMLGIRRATVTVVANVLEEEGLVSLGRREIKVLDREGLLKASCECYKSMCDATEHSLFSARSSKIGTDAY